MDIFEGLSEKQREAVETINEVSLILDDFSEQFIL